MIVHGLRTKALLTLVVATCLIPACDVRETTAPADGSLSLSANPLGISLNGDVSTITAIVTDEAGLLVRDGTQVNFTSTLGQIQERAGTIDGVAKVTLVSQTQAGMATVVAQSGAPGVSASVEVALGDELQAITLSATPSQLPAGGGSVRLRAVAWGTSSEPMADVPVVFSSDKGVLESRGNVLRTNARGEVEDRLDTVATSTVTVASGTISESLVVPVGANQVPTASFVFSPDSPEVDETVRFDARASDDSDGRIVEYKWVWGDGTSPTINSGPRTRHAYRVAGTFVVTLQVKDELGEQPVGSAMNPVTVTATANTPPTARFTFSPSQPVAGASVRFDASVSSDEDGLIVLYEWAWGDGSSPTITSSAAADHTFTLAGTYTVTLKVTDDGGATATVSLSVTVF